MFLISCFPKTAKLFLVKLRGAPVAIGAVAAMAFALGVQSAESSDRNTVTFGLVGDGKIVIAVTFDGDKSPTTKTVDTTAGESDADVVKDIVKAFGAANATPSGDTVTFKNAKNVNAGSKTTVVNVDSKKLTLNNIGAFGFDLGFADLGPPSSSLLADALITAGFAQGLSPISIKEPAGTTIEQLALDTVNALDSAGYAASLLDSNDFLLGAQGAILPDDFLLGASPVDGHTYLGISLSVSDVPESSTWAMLLIGFAGLGFAGYRRARTRSLQARA
jgi:hypothetical protein